MGVKRRELLTIRFFIYKEPYYSQWWKPNLRSLSSADDRWAFSIHKLSIHVEFLKEFREWH